MRSLPSIDTGSVAGIINFFAIHNIDLDGLRAAMFEWNRVLNHKGHLFLAAWEGCGAIDYGEESDIVALRYTSNELSEISEQAGLIVTRCTVRTC